LRVLLPLESESVTVSLSTTTFHKLVFMNTLEDYVRDPSSFISGYKSCQI